MSRLEGASSESLARTLGAGRLRDALELALGERVWLSCERRPVNVNDTVLVTLREPGAKIMADRNAEGRKLVPSHDWGPDPEAGSELRMQLWQVMQIFGPHICMSGECPIETTVQVLASR